MSFPLDHGSVKRLWATIPKTDKPRFQTPIPYLGWEKIMVSEIPNEKCYRFLEMLGVECNNNGEVLLDTIDSIKYTEFQLIMNEQEET